MDRGRRLSGPAAAIGKEEGFRTGIQSPEGTAATPFLISEWSNVQLDNYCNACGIDLVETHSHKVACFEHIRLLESNCAAHFKGPVETD